RLGRVADRLDVLAGVEEGNDAAGTAFETLITPGKGADERAPVEHELDVAAQILGMEEPFLERPIMKGKDVGDDPAARLLVRVLEGAEELGRSLAMEPGELRREIRSHGADGGIHGVIAGSRIHRPPL